MVLIIIFFALVGTLLNHHSGMIYSGGDIGMTATLPIEIFKQITHLWFDINAPGIDGTQNLLVLFPYLSTLIILYKLLHNIVLAQQGVFFLLIATSGLGIYFLLKEIFCEELKKGIRYFNIIIFCGTFFYMFNYYTMILYSHPVGRAMFALNYVFLPLVFLFFIKGLKYNNYLKNAFIFSIIFSLTTSGNPANTIITIGLLIVYLLSQIIFFKDNSRNYKKFIIFSALFVVLFNLWFLLPSAKVLLTQNKLQEVIQIANLSNPMQEINGFAKRTSLINLVRLDGLIWNFSDGFYESINKIKIIYGSQILFAILALISIIWTKKNKKILFFVFIALIGIFLAKSTHEPLGVINSFLYEKIPGFTIFRNSYDKFMPLVAFSYSILITYTLLNFIEYLRQNKILSIGLISIIISALLSQAPYFWIGSINKWSQFFMPGIPQQYQELRDFIGTNNNQSILVLPSNDSANNANYKWGYFGADFLGNYLNLPVFNSASINSRLKIEGFDDIVINNPDLLKYFNIKYIVIDNSKTSATSKELADMFKAKFKDKLVKEIGQLEIYQLADGQKISASTNNSFLLNDSRININDIFEYGDKNKINIISGEKTKKFDQFNQIYSIYLNSVKYNSDENSIEKKFNLPIKFDNMIISTNNLDIENKKETITYNNNKVNLISQNNYLVSTDMIFEKGSQDIKIKLEDNKNLVKNGDFKNKINGWGLIDATNSLPGKPEFKSRTAYDKQNNDYYVELTTSKHKLSLVQEINDIHSNSKYLLSYDSKKIRGENTHLIVENFEDKSIILNKESELTNNSEKWINNSVIFAPYTDKMNIHFQIENVGNITSIDQIKNIHLIELENGLPTIFMTNNIVDNSKILSPVVTFNKINPTKYSVNIIEANSPFILNFAEGFSPGWKLYSDSKPIDGEHIKYLDYGNSWYIEKLGSYNLTIEYEPQKLFEYGTIISISSLLILFVIIIYPKKNENQ